ncbi:MAG: VOC family protein [Brachybacterium sp.]|nr:VOC family protein [Brachybacterium sp.]
MSASSPYISFPGNAAEAFEFYAEVFGGQLDLTRYGDLPPMEGMPFLPPDEAVAHAQLTGGALTLAGGDSFAEGCSGEGHLPLASNVYSILLSPGSVEEGETLIQRIADGGGEIVMPFLKAPWGDHYGQVRDRFGLQFAINVAGTHSTD